MSHPTTSAPAPGRTPHVGPLLLVIIALASLIASGCAGELDVRKRAEAFSTIDRQQEFDQHYPTLAIAPPFFSGAFESHEVYHKSWELVTHLTDRGVPAIAPWEYRLYSPEQGMILGSDVTRLMHAEGIDPYGSLRLEVRVVMLGGSRSVDVASEQGVQQGRRAKQPGEVRLHLRPLRSDESVVEVVVAFVEDPLAEDVTIENPRPALSRAMALATSSLVDLLDERFSAGPRGVRVDLAATFNPKPMFTFTANNTPPLSERFQGLDPMELLVKKLRYYQYFDRAITVDEVMTFEASAAGLLVRNPGGFAPAGLRAGDFVLAVNGVPALGEQVLARPLLNAASQPVRVEVRRGGERKILQVGAANLAAR